MTLPKISQCTIGEALEKRKWKRTVREEKSSGSHLLFLMLCYEKQQENTNYPLKGILIYIYSYTHLSTLYTGTFVHIFK